MMTVVQGMRLTDMDCRVRSKNAVEDRNLVDQASRPHIAPAAVIDERCEDIRCGVLRAEYQKWNHHDEEPSKVAKQGERLEHGKYWRSDGIESDRDYQKCKHDQRVLPGRKDVVRLRHINHDFD